MWEPGTPESHHGQSKKFSPLPRLNCFGMPGALSLTTHLAICSAAGLVSGSHAAYEQTVLSRLRQPTKVVTPKGNMLIRKTCKCGNEFTGPETQTQCE
jgi:hypothetical protein